MKTVLITGATGAIGSRLIPELLKDETLRLELFIRAESKREAEEKLGKVLSFWGVETNDNRVMARIGVIRGDITSEYLGLPAEEYEALGATVTHIIHCATDIRLVLLPEEARRVTLGGTRNMVKLAEKCVANGQFKRFGYLSTMEVAGSMKGVVLERFITGKRKFLNTYEEAKSETEDFLRVLSGKGFPVTVYRPSMVAGDSRTGKAIKFQAFYHLMEDMLISPALPVMPCRLDWRLDIVPVDFVAKAIALTYDAEGAALRIYNITAGSGNDISLSDLRRELKLTLERLMARSIRVPIALPPRIFYTALQLLRLFSSAAARRNIDYHIAIIKFMFLNQKFENSLMRAEIEKAGIKIPRVTDYLAAVCGYYLKKRADNGKERT